MKTEKQKISFNVSSAEPIPSKVKKELDILLESGDLFRYTSNNSHVTLLEKEFASMMGMKYALAVSSCSAGLHLSLEALNLPSKAKVLLPAFTFAAVPSSIINANMRPILVEVDETYRVDISDFKLKIEEGADAVIISHMRGHTSNMDAIIEICKRNNIPIIEDAAHSLGAQWNGKKIGTLGKIGCFSFQSYKMINAGEGGIIVTNDPNIMARAVILSGAYEHNWKKHIDNDCELNKAFEKWQNKLPLYNLRMQNLSAIVIRSQLDLLDKRVEQSLKNYEYIAKKLKKIPYIDIPDSLDQETRAPDSIQFNLKDVEHIENVKRFQEEAAKSGLSIQVFGLSKDNARAFWNWKFIPGKKQSLPKTKNMLNRACDIRLPLWLTVENLDSIVEVIES